VTFSGLYHRRFDANIRLKIVIDRILTGESKPCLDPPFSGEVIRQNGFRAKLCVRKTIVGSSIQAQETGEFMSQKRRTYETYATLLMSVVVC
jgi:hypothetical protein